MIDYNQFIQWLFFGVIGFAASFSVIILAGMKRSVDDLNIRIGTIIEKTFWIEKTLERHQGEIENLKRG
jgi:hypothetical protein